MRLPVKRQLMRGLMLRHQGPATDDAGVTAQVSNVSEKLLEIDFEQKLVEIGQVQGRSCSSS